jgi:hypothetical protein
MKCLTVCNPWAAAIVFSRRTVENSTRHVKYRGPLLIHAGRRYDDQVNALVCRQLGPLHLTGVRGAIIGYVDLVDTQDVEYCQLPWASGPVCWLLKYPRVFAEPIPYQGAQGLFDVPDELVAEAIERSLSPAAWIARRERERMNSLNLTTEEHGSLD